MPHDVPPSGAGAETALPLNPIRLSLRAVHRAAAEMRRGTPVLLLGSEPLLALAVETAGPDGMAELQALAFEEPLLLLSPVRAATLLRQPVEPGLGVVALRLGKLPDSATLRGMADATARQTLPASPQLTAAPAHAHAAFALAKIARLLPALIVAPAQPGLKRDAAFDALISVASDDVLAHPEQAAAQLIRIAEARLPLEDAPDARMVAFRPADGGAEHVAILIGEPEHAKAADSAPSLARVHSECFTGDLLGSLRCDCGPQLRAALRRMAEEGTGVLLYLAQEGRGIGLASKLRAYALQDRGLDTVDANRALGWNADERSFMAAATMLEQLGIGAVRLLTNNPDKIAALAACGIKVAGREPLTMAPNGVNNYYLATKKQRLGHLPG